MHRISRLQVHELSFVLPDGRSLFHNLSFDVANERIGLVGDNGTGKSTLLALLCGALPLPGGRIERVGTIGVVTQDAADHLDPDATVAHALGLARQLQALDRVQHGSVSLADHELAADSWQLPALATKALQSLGIEHLALDRAMDSLSGGEAMRVMLAAQCLHQPDLLLLDEPTNHLDVNARDYVHALVRNWPRALLVASHDRALLAHVDRILELSSLGVRSYGGNFAVFDAQRTAEARAAEQQLGHAQLAAERTAQSLQRTRERQDRRAGSSRVRDDRRGASAIERGGARERASGSESRHADRETRLQAQAQAALDSARQRLADVTNLGVAIPSSPEAAGRVLIRFQDVQVQFGEHMTPLFPPLTINIGGRARVAIAGPNGSGKSTLLQLLAGRRTPSQGTVQHSIPLERIAFVDQRTLQLPDVRSLEHALLQMQPSLTRTTARTWLASFGFRGDQAEKPVRVLSGGERIRLALACAVSPDNPPALLLLDEPTNHLDLAGALAIETAVRSFGGALVVVSHDRSFLDAIGVTDTLSLGPATSV